MDGGAGSGYLTVHQVPRPCRLFSGGRSYGVARPAPAPPRPAVTR